MLKKLELFGFKSIRKMALELKSINVLNGANGAGKSNLIEIFRLLKSLQNNSLQLHIGKAGGANCLLHYGTSVTNDMYTCLSINADKGSIKYHYRFEPEQAIVI
jgi:predicted ATPase